MKLQRTACVLPFAILAAIFLVWQLELNKVIEIVANEEALTSKADQTHLERSQEPHYNMYKMSYDQFTDMLTYVGCSISLDKDSGPSPIRLDCQQDSMETQMVRMVLMQLCQTETTDENTVRDLKHRIQVCKDQGRQLGILPKKLRAREHAYCRCRVAAFKMLQFAAKWAMHFWFAELFGVCTILYFGMEPHLAKMDAAQRRDVMIFGIVGLAVLVARVTLYGGTVSDR